MVLELNMTEPIMRKVKGDGVTIQLAVLGSQKRKSGALRSRPYSKLPLFWDVTTSSLVPENNILAMDCAGRGLSDTFHRMLFAAPHPGYFLRLR